MIDSNPNPSQDLSNPSNQKPEQTEQTEEAIDPFKLDDNQPQTQPPAVVSSESSASASSSAQSNKVQEDDDQGFNSSPIDYSQTNKQSGGGGSNSTLNGQPQPRPVAAPQYNPNHHNELPPLPIPNIDISDIQIVDAIKTSDGPGSSSYIAYIIQSGSHRASHRYSTFSSLRSALVSLYPTIIVPPIPDKHTLTDYAAKGVGVGLSKSKDDAELVKRRRRMLQSFLRRCSEHKLLKVDTCFLRFLEGRMSWYEISTSPPLIHLPKNLLRTSLSNPAAATRSLSYSSLPLPNGSEQFNVPSPSSSSATAGLSISASTVNQAASNSLGGAVLKNPNQKFLESEAFTNRFANHIKGALEKINKKLVKKWFESSSDFGELGSILNGFSLYLSNQNGLSNAIEQVGKASDSQFLNSNAMLTTWEESFTEPLHEYSQFSGAIQRLLRFRHLKHLQLELAQETLSFKRSQLEEFERVENQAKRLDRALERGGSGLTPRSETLGAGVGSSSVYGSNSFLNGSDYERDSSGNHVNENWHRKSLYGSAAEDENDGNNAWNQSISQNLSSTSARPHPQQPPQNKSNSNDGDDWSPINSSTATAPSHPNSNLPGGNNNGNDFIPAPSPSAPNQAASIPTARTLISLSNSATTASNHNSAGLHKSTSSYSGFLGALTSTFQSVLDTDPETTRRNNISKLREQIILLEEAVDLTTKDLNLATTQIQADLDRFQKQKVQDLRDMLIGLSQAHRDFCQANLNSWLEAKEAIEKIKPSTNSTNAGDAGSEMPNARLGFQGR